MAKRGVKRNKPSAKRYKTENRCEKNKEKKRQKQEAKAKRRGWKV